MDITRVTTSLDLLVEQINQLRTQVQTAMLATRPTTPPEEVAALRQLEAQINRARAGALAARSVARTIAPRGYQTETAGI